MYYRKFAYNFSRWWYIFFSVHQFLLFFPEVSCNVILIFCSLFSDSYCNFYFSGCLVTCCLVIRLIISVLANDYYKTMHLFLKHQSIRFLLISYLIIVCLFNKGFSLKGFICLLIFCLLRRRIPFN